MLCYVAYYKYLNPVLQIFISSTPSADFIWSCSVRPQSVSLQAKNWAHFPIHHIIIVHTKDAKCAVQKGSNLRQGGFVNVAKILLNMDKLWFTAYHTQRTLLSTKKGRGNLCVYMVFSLI